LNFFIDTFNAVYLLRSDLESPISHQPGIVKNSFHKLILHKIQLSLLRFSQ